MSRVSPPTTTIAKTNPADPSSQIPTARVDIGTDCGIAVGATGEKGIVAASTIWDMPAAVDCFLVLVELVWRPDIIRSGAILKFLMPRGRF